MNEPLIGTPFNDPETCIHYLLLYTRELEGDELLQAVKAHPEGKVFTLKSGEQVTVVWCDPLWNPLPL